MRHRADVDFKNGGIFRCWEKEDHVLCLVGFEYAARNQIVTIKIDKSEVEWTAKFIRNLAVELITKHFNSWLADSLADTSVWRNK